MEDTDAVASRGASTIRIPPEQWTKYRTVIGEKYAKSNLQELMKEMKEDHGFIATWVAGPPGGALRIGTDSSQKETIRPPARQMGHVQIQKQG